MQEMKKNNFEKAEAEKAGRTIRGEHRRRREDEEGKRRRWKRARGKRRKIKDAKEDEEKVNIRERQGGGQTQEGGPQERKIAVGGG